MHNFDFGMNLIENTTKRTKEAWKSSMFQDISHRYDNDTFYCSIALQMEHCFSKITINLKW